MGIKRLRDLRRRVLVPLAEDGVAERTAEGWRLTEDWRAARQRVLDRERELEVHLYGKSADERDAEDHRRQQDAFRNRHRNRPAPAPTERGMRERREELVESLQEQVRYLREVLNEERDARRRADTIIVQLTQANAFLARRVPELAPPPGGARRPRDARRPAG